MGASNTESHNARMLRFMILALLCSAANLVPITKQQNEVQVGMNINALIDGVFATVSKELPNNTAIPDVGGSIDLHNCFLLDLNQGIHRSGNASMDISGGQTHVNVSLYATHIQVNCDWQVGHNWHKITGSLTAACDKPTMDIGLASNMSLTAHPVLTKFYMHELPDMTIQIHNAHGLDHLIDEAFNHWMKGPVTDQINKILPPIIQKELDTIHI